MAPFPNWYIFHQRLVKPKCVLEVAVSFVENKFFKNSKKIASFSKICTFCCQRDSNPGLTAWQSRALTLDHRGWLKTQSFFMVIFQMLEKISWHWKKLPPLKHILALPIWGQICTNLETELFEITNFDLGHPVILKWTTSLYAFKKSKVAW